MKLSSKFPLDILIQFLWCLLLIPVIFLDINDVLRIIIGLPVLLFIPGYMLTFLLFPKTKGKNGIDSVERFAMSFALSLAVVPIIGVGLNFTTFGLRFLPIFISLESFIFITGLLGVYRWFKTSVSDRFQFTIEIKLPDDKDITDKFLTVVLIIAVLSFIVISAYVLFTPFKSDPFTEFYILNDEGTIDEYPTFLGVDEQASLKIGIANHEHETETYTVETWLVSESRTFDEDKEQNVTVYDHMWHLGKTTTELESIPGDINEPWTSQWEYNYTFSIDRKGDFKLFFLLYKNITQETYGNFDYADLANQIIDEAYLITNLSVSVTNSPRIYDINCSAQRETQFNFLNISCSIFDIDGLNDVYLNIVGPERYRENISIISNNTELRYYCNQTYQDAGRYYYYIWANDTTDNSSRTDRYQFTITDIPVIPNIWSSKNVTTWNTSLNISGLVYDYEGLQNVSVNITFPDGTMRNISIIDNQSGDIYYSNRVYSETGSYSYYIWARDIEGNTNMSSVKQFVVIS